MNELLTLIVCGIILILSAILVFQPYLGIQLINLSLYHPWDYLAHFLTCLAGVIFFFIIGQNLQLNYGLSLGLSILIMIMASLTKELIIDPELSTKDTIGDLLGILCATCFIYLKK